MALRSKALQTSKRGGHLSKNDMSTGSGEDTVHLHRDQTLRKLKLIFKKILRIGKQNIYLYS